MIDYETMTNTLKVERVGNTFNFKVNDDKVEKLDLTNATINTKYVGFWQTGNQFRVGYDNLEVTGTNAHLKTDVPKIETEKMVKVIKETKTNAVKDKLNDCTIFYKGFPSEDKDDIAFLKKIIADAGNKFKNYDNKKFKNQQRRTDIMSAAVTKIGNSISFDIKEFATLDEAMKAAKNYIYNAQQALGNNKTSCWQLDDKLSTKDDYNFTNCYLITNTSNTRVKVRIWVAKHSADKVDLQITVSDK